jgi:ferredoxin
MKRQIIKIDEDKCNGCGECVSGCHEGALQMIDGKARIVSEIFCDGLGACIGSCPVGAITIEEREAEPYDEAKVMETLIPKGANTIKAHLKHLFEHGEHGYVKQAVMILKMKGIPVPDFAAPQGGSACASGGCPGSAAMSIKPGQESLAAQNSSAPMSGTLVSQLRHWPVQLHLVNPNDSSFDNADLLVCADCVPFAFANFHEKFVKGKRLVILCPKLDQGTDRYIEKLAMIFQTKNIKSVTIVRMEVPCCGGVEVIVQKALEKAGVSKMVRLTVVGINGDIQ